MVTKRGGFILAGLQGAIVKGRDMCVPGSDWHIQVSGLRSLSLWSWALYLDGAYRDHKRCSNLTAGNRAWSFESHIS